MYAKKFLILIFSFFLLSCPSYTQTSFITFRDCLSSVLNEKAFSSFTNQLRQIKSGQYQVLVQSKTHIYKIKTFNTLEEAQVELSKQKFIINWEQFIKENTVGYRHAIESLNTVLSKFNKDYLIDYRIKDATKLKNKIFDKIQKSGSFDLNEISDLLGIRIIVNNNSDKNTMAALFYEHNRKNNRFLNRQAHKKEGGYIAFHIGLVGTNNKPFELQILTKRMKAWDSWHHDLIYKSPYSKDSIEYLNLKRYGRAVSDYIQSLDDNLTLPLAFPNYKSFGIKENHAFSKENLDI